MGGGRSPRNPTQPNSSGANSSLSDSTGRPFTPTFSGQSRPLSGFQHSGSHNIRGNLSLTNMSGSLAPRNASLTGFSSQGVQQPGGSISGGRFPSNNLPASLSQIPHGGVSNRGGMNVGGSPVFSSNMRPIGGSIQGLSSNLAHVGNRNSVPGLAASPVLGNLGPRITNSVGNIVGGSNIGRSISSAGLSMPNVASRMSLSGNSGTGALNIQGSNRMGAMIQQASPFMNMVGSSYSASGGTLSKNQLQAGSSSLRSSGMRQDGNSGENSPFDINDFPQLMGRPNSAGGGQGQYGSLRKQGVSVNAIVQQNQEFSIQKEDFPALPGFKGNSSGYSMDLNHKDHLHENANIMQARQYPMGRTSGFNLGGSYSPRQQPKQTANSVQNTGFESIGLRPVNSPSSSSNSRPNEKLIQQHYQPQAQNPFRPQTSSGPQSNNDSPKDVQETETEIDPYGLFGLSNIIQSKEFGQTCLALGIDLTTLGLNLNSTNDLYKTFVSPWSDEPAKEEPDYNIPACYSADDHAPTLQPSYFQKFHSFTLFYIFYSMPKEEAQVYAANELYNKGWFYHREHCMWLTSVPNVAPLVKTPNYEQGSYICFDPEIWDTVHKDNFVLHYDAVEKRPVLPSAKQNGR